MSTTEKATITSQVDKTTREALEREAAEADRTLSAQVRRVLVEHVRQATSEQAAA